MMRASIRPHRSKQVVVTVHNSMLTTIHTRIEPLSAFAVAAVDPTEAGYGSSQRATRGSNPAAPTLNVERFVASLCTSRFSFGANGLRSNAVLPAKFEHPPNSMSLPGNLSQAVVP